MLNRRRLLATASALAAASCATTGGEAPPPDAALNAFFEEAFKEALARSPQFQTRLGLATGASEWDDPSEAFEAETLRLSQARLAALRAGFAPRRLTAQGRLSFALFEKQAARLEAGHAWRNHGYLFDQMNGAQSDIPAFLINQHRVSSIADAEAYIARLEGVRPLMRGLLERSRAAADAGIAPPRFVYDYVLSDARNVISGAPFSDGPPSPLWEDITTKVGALADASASDKERLLTSARAALFAAVRPAYEAVIAEMEAQKARANDADGAWKLPRGEEYYAYRLEQMTTTKLTAEEIHQLGLSEVARIQGEMRAIMSRVGFSGDLPAFFDVMETDQKFFLPNTPEGRADYIKRATAAIDAVRARLPAYFNTLPRAPLEVRAVEAFRERSAGLAFYNRPSPDGARPGIYYANTFDMTALPLYQLEALAYHEGIPGHHLQIAITQELEGLPRFRTLGSHYTAYSEGWGLYCEYLAKEMGFYEDPYSDFGRLTLELRRAIRLVVDTGIHHKRWPRQQAIQYVLDNQPGGEDQARRDIDRYIVMPGQATAYKIGQLEILRLREQARDKLGARFDIRAFHDVVLRNGAVPLDVLGDLVRTWAGIRQG